MCEEEWFDAPCPSEPCNGLGPIITWHHSNCGGLEKVNKEGILRCLKCGTKGPLYEWRFKCSNHDYRSGSYDGFCHMISIVTNMAAKANDKPKIKFFTKLLVKVNEWEERGKI